jgi:hypothetical protein
MKAYLSDPHVSEQDDRCSSPEWFRAELGAASLAEARAILAETEPKGGTGPADPTCWYEVPLNLLGPSDSAPILAESLAAFLED